MLRLQIEQGAPADVYASANAAHMKALADTKRVNPSQTFAHNELAIITPLNNPSQIKSKSNQIESNHKSIAVPAGLATAQHRQNKYDAVSRARPPVEKV